MPPLTGLKSGAFHDSDSFLIAAFSAAFFSAKEGEPSAIWKIQSSPYELR
jgi:hypothetical protein